MDDPCREIGNALEEVAYAVVGFAILGAQRAQVARRQMERCDPAGAVAGGLRSLLGHLAAKGGAPGG